MDMPNAIAKFADELDRIDKLMNEVAGVEIEAEGRMPADGLQGAVSRNDIVGDLGWMDFQPKFDAILSEDIQDRFPAPGKIGVSPVDIILGRWREEIQVLPDRAAGEAIDDFDTEQLGGLGGVFDFFGAALADSFRIAIAPQPPRQDAFMTPVDWVVGDTLTYQVGADCKSLQVVFVEDVPAALDILVVGQGFVHFEVIAPAGQLQAVETPGTGFLGHVFQGQVRPLPGE
jgi:hypothetical protein